jgi:hypothetical protein
MFIKLISGIGCFKSKADEQQQIEENKLALAHLNKRLISFGRQPQQTLSLALLSTKELGLLLPYADDLLYLKNMKGVAFYKSR